jgi:hypothetical protein
MTLRYTLRIINDSRTFERKAEFDPLPAVGDQIDAFPPAVEPLIVASVETDPETGRIVVTLEHWNPDRAEDRPVNWDSCFTRADQNDLFDGGWRKVESRK